MPRPYRPLAPSLSIHLLTSALVYTLVLSSGVPVSPRPVVAAATVRAKDIGTPTAVQNSASLNRQREGEVLVRFRPDVSEGEKNAIATARGARRGRHLRGESRFERLELTGGQTPQMLAQQLASQPSVEWVEPNYLIARDDLNPGQSSNHMPGSPRDIGQWMPTGALNNGTEQMMTGLLGAPNTWEPMGAVPPQTGTEMLIAVIDSGVDFTHPDLTASQWENSSERANNRDDDRDGYVDDMHGWDWVADSNRIQDVQGHGTSVAGIIIAEVNRASSSAGGVGRTGLMSLRVLDNTGTGDVADAVEAIDYAVAHGAQVINLSWGLETGSLALRDAIERASSRGVVVICSAGNNGRNIDGAPYYPASYDLQTLIAVAASDSADNLASWSNWGAMRVAIAAPGVDIPTTKMGGGYHGMTGTSAAAPQVSGIAGLVKSSSPGLSAADTRASIMTGARQVAGLNGKVTAGGVAEAAGAISAASGRGNGVDGGNGGGNNGNGNGNGNGGHNGNGQGGGGNGQGHGQSPQPGRPGRGSGGRGPGGSFDTAPPEATRATPPGFGNQDEIRRQRRGSETGARTFIQANSLPLCDFDCESGGGGGAGAGGSDPYFGTPRTRPENQTGQAGVDLGSRNFNWGLPLVSLPGRAGLDLGIGLYYNSLVWTKEGSAIQYNADHGFPGPGFRLGFPTVQPQYYNSDTGQYAFVMVTPSGGRVEMRQVGASNVYESADGSYTQLSDNGGGNIIVRTTGGAQMSFTFYSVPNEYRLTQIKDRNGNYISVYYDAINGDATLGRPTRVVDTLGRTVNFNYDAQSYLGSISQTWNGATHNWATFGYGELNVSTYFRDQYGYPLTVIGGVNRTVPVLTRLGLPDGSAYAFDYTVWGQINQIRRLAPDGHQLARTSYNLPTNLAAPQTDCPRLTEKREAAEYWLDGGEAITTYGAASDNSLSQVTLPDGTIYKEFYATTGWGRGLTTSTEVWSGGVKKKWTTTAWTQDDPNLWYAKNPRPAETNIYDSEQNRRRTTITYTSFSLPETVREWGGPNADQVLRRTTSYYRWDAPYLDRRIIGLPSVTLAYEGESTLMSKLEYHYDWDNHYSTQAPSVQYAAPGYFYGRGNLVGVLRYNAGAPDDGQQAM